MNSACSPNVDIAFGDENSHSLEHHKLYRCYCYPTYMRKFPLSSHQTETCNRENRVGWLREDQVEIDRLRMQGCMGQSWKGLQTQLVRQGKSKHEAESTGLRLPLCSLSSACPTSPLLPCPDGLPDQIKPRQFKSGVYSR